MLDFCPGGELFFHLNRRRRFSESEAKFYFAEILLGIEHLHRNNVLYRDLKVGLPRLSTASSPKTCSSTSLAT